MDGGEDRRVVRRNISISLIRVHAAAIYGRPAQTLRIQLNLSQPSVDEERSLKLSLPFIHFLLTFRRFNRY